MKNFLLIASKFSQNDKDNYLTNDVVDNLRSRYGEVNVIAFSEKIENKIIENEFEKIIFITSRVKFLKYCGAWLKLTSELLLLIFKKNKFDHIIMFGPLIVMWPAAYLLKFISATKKSVFVFDFFPIHQIQINAIPRVFEKLGKCIENSMLNNFTEIIVMGERNKVFAKKYYSIAPKIKIKMINLWASTIESKYSEAYSSGPIKMIFGGQMIKGRRIEQLIILLEKLRNSKIDIEIDFYSEGLFFNQMKELHRSQAWINFFHAIPRLEYKKKLSDYHVGVIVTDPNAQIPAFPSKVVDYVQAKLFVLAIVEKESEFVCVFNKYKRVLINHFSFDELSIIELAEWFELIKNNGNSFESSKLQDIFNLNNAVDILVQ